MADPADSQLRVLFLTSTFPRFDGDTQANFVGEQAAAWKAARPYDSVTILAPHDACASRAESHCGIDILRFRYFVPSKWQRLAYPAILPNIRRQPWLAAQLLPFLWAQYRGAARIIGHRHIDLIYAHWVMPQGLVAYILNKRFGTPYVLQNHSSDVRVFGKLGRAGHSLSSQIIRSARHLFCVNSAQREHALSLFQGNEAAAISAKTTVLPMGVTPSREKPLNKTRYHFGSISRLSKKKGLHHFIAAAEALSTAGFRPSVAIAGAGEDGDELKAMVRNSDVDFPGFLTGADKDRFFEQTRIFVIPSMTTGDDVEGIPVALLEALCRGKPTIASADTNITSLPEWPMIERDIFYINDPSNIEEFAATMRLAASSVGGKDGRGERLRSSLSRYWWPNLIKEYLEALGLHPQDNAKVVD